MRRRPALVSSALLAVVLVVTTGVGTAGAHGDEGELTLTKVEQSGPTTVAIEVGIVYEGDGHLAEDAQVTATLSGPDGAAVGPVPLTRTGDTTSLYAADVEVPAPGDWTVAVTSVEPAGEVSGNVTVAADAAATTSTSIDPSTSAPTTTTGADDAAAAITTTSADATDEDTDEGSAPSAAVILAACFVLAALVIGGAFLVARSRAAKDDAAADRAEEDQAQEDRAGD